MAKVLIVEDDGVIADGMARHLASAGFDPVVVGTGDKGLARLRYEQPDVVVLDLMLPERDGWSVIQAARAEGIAHRSSLSAPAGPSMTACTPSRSGLTTISSSRSR